MEENALQSAVESIEKLLQLDLEEIKLQSALEETEEGIFTH